MWKIIESSVFLRTLNFLRIRHPHQMRYALFYPLLLSSFATLLHWMSLNSLAELNVTKTLSPILKSVIILFPFYLASLAAVSTFNGPKGFDEIFKMDKDVTLDIAHRGGCKTIKLTPRYFLSLLFGYTATMSLLLLIILSLETGLSISAIVTVETALNYLKPVVFFTSYFLFAQILILTMVAIYYLSDLLHRIELR